MRAADILSGIAWGGVEFGVELTGYWIGEVMGSGTKRLRGVQAGWSIEAEGLRIEIDSMHSK
jgi:hypothetical protein